MNNKCLCKYLGCDPETHTPATCSCSHYLDTYHVQRWPEPEHTSYCSRGGWNGSTPEYSTNYVCPVCAAIVDPSGYDMHMQWHSKHGDFDGWVDTRSDVR